MVNKEYQLKKRKPLVLLLDNIRSAHNVGAIFRTADSFLVERIYLCGITPKPPHCQITKTALGAEKVVPWEKVDSILAPISILKKRAHQIIAIEQTPESISLEKLDRKKINFPIALILGHEIFGVSEGALQEADMNIEIPQYGIKKSLNVATCAGILLWELLRP
ncbi:MAG: RNA methyltransferase [Bacteroidota bacterium]